MSKPINVIIPVRDDVPLDLDELIEQAGQAVDQFCTRHNATPDTPAIYVGIEHDTSKLALPKSSTDGLTFHKFEATATENKEQ